MLVCNKLLLSENKEQGGIEANNRADYGEKLRGLKNDIKELKDNNPKNDEFKGVFEKKVNSEAETSEKEPEVILNEVLQEGLIKCNRKQFDELKDQIFDEYFNGNKDVSMLRELFVGVEEQRNNELFNSVLKEVTGGKMNHIDDVLKSEKGNFEKNLARLLGYLGNSDNFMDALYLGYCMDTRNGESMNSGDDNKAFNKITSIIKGNFALGKLKKSDIENKQLELLFNGADFNFYELKKLVKEAFGLGGWSGSNFGESDFKEEAFKDRAIFDSKAFINKFNEVNRKRIEKIKKILDGIVAELDVSGLSYDEKNEKVFKDGKEIGFKKLFSKLFDENSNLLEVNELAEPHFREIISSLKSKIEDKHKEDNGEFVPLESSLYGMEQSDYEAMKSKLGDDMFIEKSEDGTVSYNSKKALNYLKGIDRNKKWSEFLKLRNEDKGQWRAMISAIQILLNDKLGNPKLVVDGKFGGRTSEKVRDFQKKYNKDIPDGGLSLNPDGIPGRRTLTALLDGQYGDTIIEGLGKVEDGNFVFENIQEQADNDGRKYIVVDKVRYDEYREGMTGNGYQYGVNDDGFGWVYMGNFENGLKKGDGTKICADGEKYNGEWRNDNMEGEGTYIVGDGEWKGDRYKGRFVSGSFEGFGIYTRSKGNSVEGNWVDGSITEGTIKLKSSGVELNATRNSATENWKVISEGEYKDRIISYKSGELEGVGND